MTNLQKFALLIACVSLPALAHAEEVENPTNLTNQEDDKGIFSLVIENDIFAGTDQDYTNGFRASWLSSEENMPQWAKSLANKLPVIDKGKERISIAVGQNIYTPADVTSTAPVPGDHPYAGWLYGSVGLVSDTGETLDNVMLTVGVVGPWSLAEPTQDAFHNLIGTELSNGWDNQLENEVGVILTYERKWRNMYEISPFGLGVDATPHVGVNLGNINTDASIGATFRLGYDLPADYGPPRIRPSLPGSDFFVPSQDLGGYLFASAAGHAVARNIFLDGNTFSDSVSVDKKNFVSSLQVGAAVTYENTRLSYTQVFSSKQYDTQINSPEYGVVTLSYRF